jgi:hypothetical protein
VATLDLQSGREDVLYDCGGCWSPLPLPDGSLLVAKANGIWKVPATSAAATLVVTSDDFFEVILGIDHQASSDRAIVLVRRGSGTACSRMAMIVDPAKNTLEPGPVLDGGCDEPLPSTARMLVRFNDGRLLGATTVAPHELLLKTVSSIEQSSDVGYTRVTIQTPTPGVSERFDPAWQSHDVIVYVANR